MQDPCAFLVHTEACGSHLQSYFMVQASCWSSSHHLCVPDLRKECRQREEGGRKERKKRGKEEGQKGNTLFPSKKPSQKLHKTFLIASL